MSEELENKVSIEENGDLKIPTKQGINVSFNITEILKILITEHFTGTLFALIIGALIYFAVVYDVNILTIFPISENYKLPVIFDIGLFILLIIGIIKITKLNNYIECNIVYSKDINKQFIKLKDDIDHFSKSLYSLYDIYNESNISLVTLNKIINDNVYDIKKIMNVLNNINNGIKRIPDKRTINDILTIRTKLLFGSAMEIISEYLSNISFHTNKNNQLEQLQEIQQLQQLQQIYSNQNINISKLLESIQNNSNNNVNNSFIEEKMQHKIEEIKNQYITDIFILSKNTLNVKCKDNIQSILNAKFEEIKKLIFGYNHNNNNIDVIIYNVDHEIKTLTLELMDIFANNLLTSTVFDSEVIAINEEKEDERVSN